MRVLLADILPNSQVRDSFVCKVKAMGIPLKVVTIKREGHTRPRRMLTITEFQFKHIEHKYRNWYWHSDTFDFCLQRLRDHFRYVSQNETKEADAKEHETPTL